MPLCAIKGEIDGRYRAIIDVGVFKKKPSRAEAENPAPENRFRALIDTGAGRSAVSKKIAEQLGLVSKGEKRVGTPNGILKTPTYNIALAVLRIPL